MKNNLIGTVTKIRVLKTWPEMLVRFTLISEQQEVNCLVAQKNIANQLLFFEEGLTEVAVYGHYNLRQQLVIEKMMMRQPTKFLMKYTRGVS